MGTCTRRNRLLNKQSYNAIVDSLVITKHHSNHPQQQQLAIRNSSSNSRLSNNNCITKQSCRYSSNVATTSTTGKGNKINNALILTQRLCSNNNSFRSSSQYNVPFCVGGFGVLYKYQQQQSKLSITDCEEENKVTVNDVNRLLDTSDKFIPIDDTMITTKQRLVRYWRIFKRILKLAVAMTPLAIFYPIYLLASSTSNKNKNNNNTDTGSKDARDIVNNVLLDSTTEHQHGWIVNWYYRLCLNCVENSGACVIKLMQWAGSRPDLFGFEFCSIFSKLQDKTNPHSWYHTEKLLQQAYGTDWNTRIDIPYQQDSILGSGCIGQVYYGRVKLQNDTWQDVAIKVLHPNVSNDIDADLDLLRLAAYYLPSTEYKWLNPLGIVEELARLLRLQMNLCYEGKNLIKFAYNFRNNKKIKFPSLIAGYEPTQSILIEEYCTGIPVLQYCRDNYNTPNRTILSDLCRTATEAVCQMIFIDNFVHGDLHPGNVFVSPDGKQFILLDVGIVNEYSPKDHQVIVDVLSAFIYKDGRLAGRLMIDDSNNKMITANIQDSAINEELYIDKIEALTIRASTKGYLMEHLGTYISYICSAASQHHVMMNASFISAALAIKIQEGIALAMDPSVKIPNIAIPIILQSKGMGTKIISGFNFSGYNSAVATEIKQSIDGFISMFTNSSSSTTTSSNDTTTGSTTTTSSTTATKKGVDDKVGK